MSRRRPPPRQHRMAGFTLLEAIVAMVVFTMGAFALYGWLSTNTITLNRVRDRQQVEQALHSSLDLIRRSNPMKTPSGKREVGDLEVSWSSVPLEPPRPNVDQSGSPGIFMVGLYEVDVRVLRDDRELQAFKVRQVGWNQVRAMDDL